jgi:hypothetical protein
MTRITYVDARTGWVLETARIFSDPRFIPVPRQVLAEAGIKPTRLVAHGGAALV